MKYKNIIVPVSVDGEISRIGAGAYRVTTTYTDLMPDIKYLYKNDYHRTDGPAVIDLQCGFIIFCVSETEYVSTKEFCKAARMSREETFMWLLRFGDELPRTIEGFYGENWEDLPMDQL